MTINPRVHLAIPGTVATNLDANGNLTVKLNSYTLTWNADGIRLKQVSNGVATEYYYVKPFLYGKRPNLAASVAC